ncbi:hypothetical protein K3495_g5428 [Podosphaera aphanis]|nr:hypothetical protein K3495_g5428 [Podosphaera aphanis]
MYALTSRKFWVITPTYTRSLYSSLHKNPVIYNGIRIKSLYPRLIRILEPVRQYSKPHSSKKEKKKKSPPSDISSENSQQEPESAPGTKTSSPSKKAVKSAKPKKKRETKDTNNRKSLALDEDPSKEEINKESDSNNVPKKAEKKKKPAAKTVTEEKTALPPGRQKTLLNILGDVEMPEASKKAVLKAFKLSSDTKTASSKSKKKSKVSSNVKPKPSKGTPSLPPMKNFETIDAQEVPLTPVDKEEIKVPTLSYGLDRVLFNHGVYQLQDPRTRVFNFDPYLQEIMPVSQFDYGALGQYITSSRDNVLLAKAAEEKRKYAGSTSSMSSALSHFHFLLSDWRPIEYGNLSSSLPAKLKFSNFTLFTRAPSAIFLRYRDGSYGIDADKEFDDSNILAMLGKSMEKLLTLPTEHYEKYRRENSDQLTEQQRNERESYHYTTFGDFLLRSQLDAYDPRLPGTGTFDLKTRCVVSVRMDVSEYENSKAYEIRKAKGEWESYEREYYDMIRAAFLKYSMQVRMGRMDGIFVAFHNTARIFGFQYISLEEMDFAIHGTDDLTLGDGEFKLSLHLLNKILNRATAKFPEKTLRLYFETPTKAAGEATFMNVIAQPLEDEEADLIQAGAKERIERFERKVLGIVKDVVDKREIIDEDLALDHVESNSATINTDQNKTHLETEIGSNLSDSEKQATESLSLDQAMGKASLDQTLRQISTSSESILENATSGEDLQAAASEGMVFPSETTESITENSASSEENTPDVDQNKVEVKTKDNINNTDWTTRPFLAMKLSIRNKVNGKLVNRPEKLTKDDKWSIDYELSDYPAGKYSKSIYRDLRQRLKKINSGGLDMSPDKPPIGELEKNLRKYIEKGRIFRELENEIQSKLPKKVLDIAMWGKQSSENLRKEALAAQKKKVQEGEDKISDIRITDAPSSL